MKNRELVTAAEPRILCTHPFFHGASWLAPFVLGATGGFWRKPGQEHSGCWAIHVSSRPGEATGRGKCSQAFPRKQPTMPTVLLGDRTFSLRSPTGSEQIDSWAPEVSTDRKVATAVTPSWLAKATNFRKCINKQLSHPGRQTLPTWSRLDGVLFKRDHGMHWAGGHLVLWSGLEVPIHCLSKAPQAAAPPPRLLQLLCSLLLFSAFFFSSGF